MPDRVGRAVAAVANARDGEGVIVHCFAGKDRTGIVSALLLSLAGVSDDLIAADYAASDPGVELLSAPWFASARDETELQIRRRISISPHATMLDVLAGCTRPRVVRMTYLLSAGRHGRSAAAAARPARRLKPGRPATSRRGPCARPVETACASRSSSSPSGSSSPVPPPCSSARAQQPVGELRIPRQQRPVQVGADGRCHPTALETGSNRRFHDRRPPVRAGSLRRRAPCGRRDSRTRRPSSSRRRRGRLRVARRRSAASRRRVSHVGRRPRLTSRSRRDRGSRGRAAGSHRRPRAPPCPVSTARRRSSPRVARSGAISACSRSWPPPT